MHRMTPTARILVTLGLLAVGVLTVFGLRATTRVYMQEGQARAETTLALTLQALEGNLGRYDATPGLLAESDGVRALLDAPSDMAARAALNQWLAEKNAALESLDIYVMTPDGITIAASNFGRADSFIGQNFSYRPYFQTALAGGRGRFYAIGTTSGVRGYYFASPVRNRAGGVSGVLAVKIGLDVIEAEWRRQDAQIMVTDPDGIVFLSTDPGWLYKAMLPLTADRMARTQDSRRYADVQPVPLDHTRASADGVSLLTLPGAGGVPREFVVAGQLLPRADWTVQVLLDTAPLHAQARLTALAALLFLGAVGAVCVVFVQRRMRLGERLALQEQAKADLEQRVAARTADLARVNALMQAEVAERRLTEAELRRTQTDLIQAGKLAALGEMSAALSHEINQPLAAARNYADSAAILMDRGEAGKAKDNIGQILSLIDRVATIARHLRNVARKPDTALKDIALGVAVAEALAMVQPRLAQVAVQVDVRDDLPRVRGGPVRLQQVLVNLLSNAADAVADVAVPHVWVSAAVVDKRVHLMVRDNGPGVPAAIAGRIFDPFFTTKRVGSGLGLGLSISYNILKDFGGDLRVANAPEGGAVFTVEMAVASRLHSLRAAE